MSDDKHIFDENLSDGANSPSGSSQMLVIPEANLKAVYQWLDSNSMVMPYNQVKSCLSLLKQAVRLEDHKRDN